jgi:hypothetical protein
MSLVDLFCEVDDFCQLFIPHWKLLQLRHGECKRVRACRLLPSEIMTILIHFHPSHYRHFKAYYRLYVSRPLNAEFPHLVSYTRFVALIPSVLQPLGGYLNPKEKSQGLHSSTPPP